MCTDKPMFITPLVIIEKENRKSNEYQWKIKYYLGDLGSIPGLGISPGGRHGNPLQYSYLENFMDRRAWQATVHGIAKSRTRLKRLSMQAPSKGQSWGLSLHLCCSWPPYCAGHEHLSDYHLVLVQNFCPACVYVPFWVP